jgi:hypothetical protein
MRILKKFFLIWSSVLREEDLEVLIKIHLDNYPEMFAITTNVASSNFANGEVYSIQHYVMQFVSDLRQVNEKKILLSFTLFEMGVVIGTDCIGSNKSNYHMITTPSLFEAYLITCNFYHYQLNSIHI